VESGKWRVESGEWRVESGKIKNIRAFVAKKQGRLFSAKICDADRFRQKGK